MRYSLFRFDVWAQTTANRNVKQPGPPGFREPWGGLRGGVGASIKPYKRRWINTDDEGTGQPF